MPSQNIYLLPGAHKHMSFIFTPTQAKTYQVSVDGLKGSFVCLAAPPVIGAISLIINCPLEVADGEWIRLGATVGNKSDKDLAICIYVDAYDSYYMPGVSRKGAIWPETRVIDNRNIITKGETRAYSDEFYMQYKGDIIVPGVVFYSENLDIDWYGLDTDWYSMPIVEAIKRVKHIGYATPPEDYRHWGV